MNQKYQHFPIKGPQKNFPKVGFFGFKISSGNPAPTMEPA
jgi:hypothetical protein